MSRSRLSRKEIVSTAIRIADEKGLPAVTLRGIATRLGVHVTSLYNHVPTKEAVFDEMIRALVVQAELPTGPFTWRDWVQNFAAAMRTLAHEHPGAFEVFHHAPAQGERAGEAFEAAIAAFRAAGFDTVSAYNAVKATSLAVLGLMLEDTARVRRGVRRSDLSELSAERFPHLHEVACIVGDADTFSYLIDVLIDGLAAHATKPSS